MCSFTGVASQPKLSIIFEALAAKNQNTEVALFQFYLPISSTTLEVSTSLR